MTTTRNFEPVPSSGRVQLLDGLRGAALLGIMFVNMTWFTGYAVLSDAQRTALGTRQIDDLVNWSVHAAIDSKFWSLFALLFGVGFAMQLRRAQERGVAFGGLFARRMLVLAAIGLAHAALLWFGDIVSIYAVTGLALLLFMRRSDATLMLWSIVLLLLPIAISACWWLVDAAMYTGGAPRTDPGHGPAELLPVFGNGSYAQVLHANWPFLTERWYLGVYTGRYPVLLGMFLLGVLAVRRLPLERIDQHGRFLRRAALWGFLISVPCNIYLASMHVPLRPPSAEGLLATTARSIGTPALCICYASSLVLVLQRPTLRIVLTPLALVGRMSLTHYMLQSVIGVALFYGYGFALWGSIGITWSVAIIAAIFAAQIALSAWWLRWFRYGPIEWVWRCLTYMRPLPLRRRESIPASERSGSKSDPVTEHAPSA